MQQINIAIVGFGSRGLTIFERIIAFLNFSPSIYQYAELKMHIFDTNPLGTGSHAIDQPEYLLVNTVASQITQFSDDSIKNAGPTLYGPSFYEWLVDHPEHLSNLMSETTLSENAYYPRALFGKYLHWCYHYLLELAPLNLKIIHHDSYVKDIIPLDKQKWRLIVQHHAATDVDFIFLTTGHARKKLTLAENKQSQRVNKLQRINKRLKVILNPYPITDRCRDLQAPDAVAIVGAGLTAFDVITELTIGRGGKFSFDICKQEYRYQPSGYEPKILLLSRSGLPLSARAFNQKGAKGQYEAKFFTMENILNLKLSRREKLDFKTDILPLLLLEMRFVYYFTLIKNTISFAEALRFSNRMLNASIESREKILASYTYLDETFCFENLVAPYPQGILSNQYSFQQWLMHYLQLDIAASKRGNIDDPMKAACDVIRDLRDTLRYVVDYGGLTDQSHEWFNQCFVPIMNRLAVGPPKERIQELIALMNAQIIQFNFGPNPTYHLNVVRAKFEVTSTQFKTIKEDADVLVHARIAMPTPEEDESELMQNLLRRGIVKPFRNGSFYPGGIQINKNLNIINANDKIVSTIWALGTLTEGCRFYTFVVPRPGVNSTSIVDAGRAVGKMLQTIAKRTCVETPVMITNELFDTLHTTIPQAHRQTTMSDIKN